MNDRYQGKGAFCRHPNRIQAAAHTFLLDYAEMHCVMDRNMIEFRLDPSRQTLALQEARGFWFVERPEGRPEGWSRIWLKGMVKCDPLLPKFIVEYAAGRSLPRASVWLQPVMKEIGQLVRDGSLGNVHGLEIHDVEVRCAVLV